jgi:hypothetical protein
VLCAQGRGLPVRAGAPLPQAEYAQLLRRLALDGCKWDLQLADRATVAPYPLLLQHAAWDELRVLAAALGRELMQMVARLEERPDLYARLAVPRRLRRFLRPPFSRGPWLLRCDFHFTDEGWRISEVNADVPGGLVEASLLTRAFGTPLADPSAAWADAIVRAANGGHVALLSAPGYLEDHQVVAWLSRELFARGADVHLASTRLIEWRDGTAWLRAGWHEGPLGAVVRFHQAEWLRDEEYFRGAKTPIANPAVAVLAESKRLPLVWPELQLPLPTWRRLLPETRDVPLDGEWLWKKAYSNTGDDVTPHAPLAKRKWAAQRRFSALAVETPEGPRIPCLGVYVLDGEAIGVYGRLAHGELVDWQASDVAVIGDQ